MSSLYATILAGGEGTRFAPLSTPELPKQFLALVGETSLIRQTADRIRPLVDSDHWLVATHARYLRLVQNHLPEVSHIIGETEKKNTAPAIALAAAWIAQQDPTAIMIVLPSDHVILNEPLFHSTLSQAISVAEKKRALVTLGIVPTWASPEYGYIERAETPSDHAYAVKRFVEKPKTELAERYLASGHYYWNSGMFIWPVQVILDEVRSHLPKLAAALRGVSHFSEEEIRQYFAVAESISIDYGVMEKSKRVWVVPAEFGWSDVGGWQSLKSLVDSGKVKINQTVQRYLAQVLA